MTRFKSIFAAVVASAIVAVVPAASAQNAHFVGAGSSAQWQMAAIAADQLALNENGGTVSGSQGTIYHWTFSNGGTVSDNRDTLNRITPELGNIWLVWIADGSGNVTTSPQGFADVWIALSVDSTVGVRTFSAQEKISNAQVSGGQIQINQSANTAGGNKINSNLWPDNQADANLSAQVLAAVNTAVSGGLHVNVGLTDIRPEDALFATVRSLTALNTTTWAGLGYVGPTGNIGAPINTNQGTGTSATPIKFALSGKPDPFNTAYDVPAYTTIPIGAAPIVFVYNNGGTYSSAVSNLISGVLGTGSANGAGYPTEPNNYKTAGLFDGTSVCDTHNPAFGGNGDGAGTPITLILREPLSGTMNTTEYNLFRTTGNTKDSQEVGVINPTRSPYNPLDLGCPTHGLRSRAIGTGEVVNAVKATANTLGYIFFGFGNAAKLSGSSFNYLTLDGVDPIALPTTNQELPNCTAATCPANQWSGSLSYPHLRDGSYKAWSIYRWLIANSNIGSDPYGFDAVAQGAQDYVDQDVADFVPFLTSTGSDGLSVYRSHFTQESVTGDNGSLHGPNSLNNGYTLGGGPEAGGDEGGLIEGPFGITVPTTTGTVNTTATLTTGKGYKITWHAGDHFTAGTSWEGSTITINNVGYTVASCATCTPTTTGLYVTTSPGTQTAVAYSAPFPFTYPAATTPGVLNKHE